MKFCEDKKEYFNVYSPLKKEVHQSVIHQDRSNPFTKFSRNVMHPLTKDYLDDFETSTLGVSSFGTLSFIPVAKSKSNETSFITLFKERGIDKDANFYKVPSHQISDESLNCEMNAIAKSKTKRSLTAKVSKDFKSSIVESFSLLTQNAASMLAEISTIPLVSMNVIKNKAGSLHLPTTLKKTIVFDLDETLVHSSFQPVKNASTIYVQGKPVYIKIRPNTHRLLQSIYPYYNIIVFTASMKQYADAVLNYLDKDGLISYRIYREHCVMSNGFLVKDLRVLNRDLGRIILVDNCITCMAPQPDNGIPVKSYNGEDDDNELLKLESFLLEYKATEDIRNVLVELFKLRTLSLYSNALILKPQRGGLTY